MIKPLILAIVVAILLLILMRRFPALAARLGHFLRHPLIRTVLIQGCLRVLRFLIFRR